MSTTIPYDITAQDATRLIDVIKGTGTADSQLGIAGLFKRLWGYFSPDACPGSYSHLASRLDAMDTLIDAAGTGSNRLLYGTDAERLALSPVPNPCAWIATDTDEVWFYDTTWHRIPSLTGDNVWEFAGDVEFGAAASFTSVAPEAPAPTTPDQLANKEYVDNEAAVQGCYLARSFG